MLHLKQSDILSHLHRWVLLLPLRSERHRKKGTCSLWITSSRDPSLFILLVFGCFLTSVNAPATAERTEVVCNSRDIRNTVEMFRDLANCTVIEGSLQILLIDYADPSQYDDVSFPKLVEITDYLLLYRVYGLKSLSRMFPNLSVIRGRKLFFNYALVAFEMPDLEDLGLLSLTRIERGAVRLEKNAKLCYVDTIDWSNLTHPNIRPEDNFIVGNKQPDDCVNVCPKNPMTERSVCPTKVISNEETGHHEVKSLCWNSQHCQKICPSRCGPESCYEDRDGVMQCCDSQCMGGCYGPGPGKCKACKNVFSRGYCKEYCTETTYKYWNRRCITEEQCRRMGRRHAVARKAGEHKWKMHAGQCLPECPINYMVDLRDEHKCKLCDGTCPKVCRRAVVDSVAAAQALRGCTVIEGYLEIQIRGGNRVGLELENNLGSIQMVTGALKIVRSEAILSLGFLQNLTVIQGQSLVNDRYAMFVLDNQNLQDIWDFKMHANLTILRGTVFFHQNHKLCLSKINHLVKHVGLESKVDDVDVSRINNGDQVACNISRLRLEVKNIRSTFAFVQWNNFQINDQRMLLNYVIYYREAPEQNITIFNARDACGTDIWKTSEVRPLSEPQPDEKIVAELIFGLSPWTQYAMYVQTYTIATADRGAMSSIVYFRTKPAPPTPPRHVEVTSLKWDELLVKWEAPSKPNGNVTHYYVYWQPQPLSREKLDQRNYCRDKLHLSHLKRQAQMEAEKKQNETKKNENCCECPKSEEDLKHEEEERMFQIEFENFLHNTVYHKRPINAINEPEKKETVEERRTTRRKRWLQRRRGYRDVGSRSAPGGGGGAPGGAGGDGGGDTIDQEALDNTGSNINSSYIDMLMEMKAKHNMTVTNDTEESDSDHSPYKAAVVYNKLEFVMSNLNHFEEYSIEVVACHEADECPELGGPCDETKRCSNRAITTGRTLPKDGADDIAIENVTSQNDTDGRVRLRWHDPVIPNGLIVTYEIKYSKVGVTNVQPMTICIPHKLYRKYHDGYILPSPEDTRSTLNTGNYMFQIRATSLSGNGSWTQPMYFFVPDRYVQKGVTTALIAGVSSLVFLLLLLVPVALYVYYRRKLSANNPPILWSSVNPDYMASAMGEAYQQDEWEIDRDKITLLQELGKGSFGMVHEGIYMCEDERKPVAVKTVGTEATPRDRWEFLNEASVMKAFTCHHVVQLLGVVSLGQPTLVVMELMAQGDLKNYLRKHRPDEEEKTEHTTLSLKSVFQMAGEIADGMAYLAAKKFVHRDVAARNCMVDAVNTVKIGDFGMTRDIYETDYYRKGGRGLMPVRWMSPESIKDGVFSSQTDVWAFGVVLWEMVTLAEQPYQGLSNEEVCEHIKAGETLKRPVHCNEKLFYLMQLCWRFKPSTRPTFVKIVEMLVPDLDPSFRDVAFFFSDENMDDGHPDAGAGAQGPPAPPRGGGDQGDIEMEEYPHAVNNDYYRDPTEVSGTPHLDELRTPLTGTPSRHSLSLSDIDVGTPYRSNASLSDSVGRGDALCINMEPSEQIKLKASPHLKNGGATRGYGDAGERTPKKGSSPRYKNTASSHKTPSGSPPQEESSFTEPSSLPLANNHVNNANGVVDGGVKTPTNEGSKESSKSSGSSSVFHLNGFANGHIPRANNVPHQGDAQC